MAISTSYRRILRVFLQALVGVLVLVAILAYWAVGTALPKESSLEVNQLPDAAPIAPKETLTVVTYNIAHSQGIKEKPTDWRDAALTQKKLEEMTAAIKTTDADVLMMQEVDLESNRTHFINQALHIAKNARYPFYACASNWEKNYIPFPFWPPQFHLGKMRGGICILSRYPLKDHQRIVFDKPKANPFWYNWGYTDRSAQSVVITIGNQSLTLFNTHLEAFDKATRHEQVKVLADWIKKVEGPIVLGGDFNAAPPEATQKNHFPDDAEENYEGDHTIEIIRAELGNPTEAISIESYKADEKSACTFRSDNPTRKIDYVFAARGARVVEGHVIKEASVASDHLPLWAKIHYRW